MASGEYLDDGMVAPAGDDFAGAHNVVSVKVHYITLQIPIAEGTPDPAVQNVALSCEINRLPMASAAAKVRLRQGLAATAVTLDGQPIKSDPDAVKWLLAAVAAEIAKRKI